MPVQPSIYAAFTAAAVHVLWVGQRAKAGLIFD
jgi:hypothetical protein